MTIVIIDSGLDKNSIQHRENIVQKTFLRKKTGEVELYDGAKDDIGHGTAIFHIIDRHIKNHCSNIEYIIIKVIQKDMFYTDEIVLTAALTWLVQNKLNCNIINISLGCTMLANSNALYNYPKKVVLLFLLLTITVQCHILLLLTQLSVLQQVTKLGVNRTIFL